MFRIKVEELRPNCLVFYVMHGHFIRWAITENFSKLELGTKIVGDGTAKM
jgi:hypothetical protein